MYIILYIYINICILCIFIHPSTYVHHPSMYVHARALLGEDEKECDEERCAELARALIGSELVAALIARLGELHFETRKDVALVFGNLARRDIGGFVGSATASCVACRVSCVPCRAVV